MNHSKTPQQDLKNPPGFFSIIPRIARLIWRYGKRLFSVNTLVSLEKKQGQGSGERPVELDLLDRALERNPHQYHVPPQQVERGSPESLSVPVKGAGITLVVKRGGR